MISYFDTSVLLKLLVEDEHGSGAVDQLWLASDHVLCAEIGYVEARAALASARRANRLEASGHRAAVGLLDQLWDQIDVVLVDTVLIRSAADLAEAEALRGYDAVHLAAAVAGGVDVVACADAQLTAAAARRGFDVADPGRLSPGGR